MNWKWYGINQSWPNLMYCSGISLEELIRSMEKLRIAGLRPEIWTEIPLIQSSSAKHSAAEFGESSWLANSHSSSHEITRFLWNQKVHYHVHKSPPPVPTEPDESSPFSHSLTSILILPSHLCIGLTAISSLQFFWLKCYMHFLSLPCVLHSPPISSWFDHLINVWNRMQIMEVPVT
jgi:hypothetical protein